MLLLYYKWRKQLEWSTDWAELKCCSLLTDLCTEVALKKSQHIFQSFPHSDLILWSNWHFKKIHHLTSTWTENFSNILWTAVDRNKHVPPLQTSRNSISCSSHHVNLAVSVQMQTFSLLFLLYFIPLPGCWAELSLDPSVQCHCLRKRAPIMAINNNGRVHLARWLMGLLSPHLHDFCVAISRFRLT